MPESDNIKDKQDVAKSKSQVKREMQALQELGKRLTLLNKEQLEQVPLEEPLAKAVQEYKRLRHHEAQRRQLQFIGRLMRSADNEPIVEALNRFDASKAEHVRHFHAIEIWRERLLDDPDAATEFIATYPQTDVQQLRQLIRNAQNERTKRRDLGGAKKLFRLIRTVLDSSDSQ